MAQDLVDSDVGFTFDFKCNMKPLEDFKQEWAMVYFVCQKDGPAAV